ncbi:uncharacterized protein V1510DRAFT_323219 [Dipodascopsis tothii]|uniref:uncharacterized protein n=1 Tax=Dipodascopsis tothii TaxID=44089 RepID=UPI0034CD4097
MHPASLLADARAGPSYDDDPPPDSGAESSSTAPRERVVRKRRRIPVACAVCRQRKLKCDRKFPCSACLAHGTVGLCEYAQPAWSTPSRRPPEPSATDSMADPATDPAAELASLARRGGFSGLLGPRPSAKRGRPRKEPYPEDYSELKERMGRMEFLLHQIANGKDSAGPSPESGSASVSHESNQPSKDTSPAEAPSDMSDMNLVKPEISIKPNRVCYFGSTSFVAAITEDEFLKKCLVKIYEAKRQWYNTTSARLVNATPGDPTKIPSIAGHKHMEPTDLLPRTDFYTNRPDSSGKVGSMSDKQLRMSWDPNVIVECHTLFRYQFPRPHDRPICEFLVSKYLSTINRVYPTISPEILRSEIQIFWDAKIAAWNSPPGPDGQPGGGLGVDGQKLDTPSKMVMRALSLLIAVVRLGRLSLPTTWKPSENGFDDAYAPMLTTRLYGFASCTLRRTNYMAKPNLTIAQILILLKLHHVLTPEDGDGGDGSDSSVFTGMLCQLGLTMGLHRDPSFFPKIPPTMAQSWRQIWRQMVLLDTSRSLELSIPFAIPLEMCDNKLESFSSSSTPVDAAERPSEAFERIHMKWALLARKVIVKITRPNRALTSYEYDQLQHELTQFEDNHLQSFQLLISVLQEGSTICSHEDAYNLIQKFVLQVLFLRLQLSLLRAYVPPTDEFMKHRMLRLRTSLKLTDTICKCMQNRKLFLNFECILISLSLRNQGYPLTMIYSQIFKVCSREGAMRDVPQRAQFDQVPDLSFRYDDNEIMCPLRLWQAVYSMQNWVETLSSSYYAAWKCGASLYGIGHVIRQEFRAADEARVYPKNRGFPYVSEASPRPDAASPGSKGSGASTVNSISNLLEPPLTPAENERLPSPAGLAAFGDLSVPFATQPGPNPAAAMYNEGYQHFDDFFDIADWMSTFDFVSGTEPDIDAWYNSTKTA